MRFFISFMLAKVMEIRINEQQNEENQTCARLANGEFS
jgi:hypothetical protein